MRKNLILMADSYKYSHKHQYPENTTTVFSYIEPRKDKFMDEFEYIVMNGTQGCIKEIFMQPITMEDINEAEELITMHGEPFYREDWEYILNKYNGYIPVRIKGIAEGTVLPTKIPLISIENTDPKCFWLTSFLETLLLRAIWYPVTVASISYNIKQIIKKYFEETVDEEMQGNIMFKLHDFGSRGASSSETAAIGGAAHLINFMGSDNVEALRYLRKYYGVDCAGYSIPAAEHSTICSWGRENEVKAFENMINQFGGQGKIFACVSDSYDIYNACENLWGDALKDKVINNGGTLVVRPDSGDPVEVTLKVIEILGNKFGYEVNKKGYKVLPPFIRIIQGDGVNPKSIKAILENYKQNGWSADNIAFGMGGALLQKLDRDTLSFAMKTSYAIVDGFPTDVFKDPITDTNKKSKTGKIKPVKINGKWNYGLDTGWDDYSCFETIYENGKLLKEITFEEIRENSNNKPLPRQF